MNIARTVAIAFLTLTLLPACHGYRSFSAPKTEATADEQQQIRETLNKLSDLTEKFGPRREFNSIPILVTTENFKEMDRAGYCFDSQVIVVNRAYLGDRSVNSRLPSLLLHEIGHCYFNRPHDNQTISQLESQVVVYDNKDPMHSKSSFYPESTICLSVMCSKAGAAPTELLEYYVGEVLGRVRAKDLSDLQKYADIHFITKAVPRIGSSLPPSEVP